MHCRFPIARDSFRGYYYPYGNTPPEDLLEHVRSCEEPSILLLGCGDIRSCLYTLWKHFDPLYCNDLCTRIQFTLNDQCAAVLARNVLFLYLLLEKAEAKEKEWIPSIWAIWYCHELLPHHLEVLKSALTDLLSLSASQETWTTSNHPTCSMCCFSGETLQQVREVWKVWRYKPFGTPESVKTVRQKMQASCGFSAGVSSHYVSVFLGEMRQGMEETTFDAMVRDYEYYAKEGTAYAEVVCEQLDMYMYSSNKLKHSVNPTFFERYLETNIDSNQYIAYCTLVPYRCFYHSMQFTLEEISQCGLHEGKMKQLVVKSAFKKHPLLANSVQQFSLWLSSAAKVLKNKKPCVTFSFHCLDAIEHCQIMLKDKIKFDVIYSSNLLDYLSPILLVLPAVDLLKENCVMITTSLKSSVKIEEFIEQSFGFNSELLPVVFGIRCIGHDGQYTDHYSIEPIPYLPSSKSCFLDASAKNEQIAASVVYCFALPLIWEKVQLEPLRVLSLSEVPVISNALHSVAKKAITSFFLSNPTPVPITSTKMAKQIVTTFLQDNITHVPITTTETAIIAFLTFISQLYSTVPYDSHHFWKHLCDLLKADSTMKPFLHQIQTHALLHGLHLHLVLKESDCPVCKKLPVSDFICQLAVEFPVPFSAKAFVRPAFTIFLHSKGNFNSPLTSKPWEMEASVIDSIACKWEDSKIEINFFTSIDDMVITVVAQDVCDGPHQKVICSSLPVSCSRKIEPFIFSFVRPNPQPLSSPSSFGILLSHAGNSSEFCSKIELSEEVSSALKECKKNWKTKHPSLCVLEMSVKKHHFQLIYPYDIVYTKIRMILAKDKATVDLKITRDCRKWSHEKPLFITCPSNKFCFPDLMITNHQLLQYDGRQFTLAEIKILRINDSLGMIGAKQIISALLHSDCQYITMIDSLDALLVHGFVVIHRKLFDIEKYSPAIHVSFVMETRPADGINMSDPLWNFWQSVSSLHWQISKNEAARLKELLMHFAARTWKHKTNGPIISRKHCLEQFFTQAVVYPLYLDKDKYAADI